MKKHTFILLTLIIFSSCEPEVDNTVDKLVTIKTSFGDMTVLLYDETPLHKANFLELAESGQYDSTLFYRVMPEFMIQGGDIHANKGTRELREDLIPAEFVDTFFHKKGELAAARQEDKYNPKKRSSSSQFYIVHGKTWTEKELTTDQPKLNAAIQELLRRGGYDSLNAQLTALQRERKFEEMMDLAMDYKEIAEKEIPVNLTVDISPEKLKAYTTIGGVPHLDGEYTVFGRVVEGLEVIDKIASVVTTSPNRPIEDIYTFMEVATVSKIEITEKYGYEYPKKKSQ